MDENTSANQPTREAESLERERGGQRTTTRRRGSSSSIPAVGLRRQSTSERINEILETGRERAERSLTTRSAPALDVATTPLSRTQSTPAAAAGPATPQTQPMANLPEDGIPPDETTGIISRDRDAWPGPNYQTNGGGSMRSRRRPSPAEGQETGREGEQEGEQQEEQDGARRGKETKNSWFVKLLEPFQSIELENKGSVARDHLAIERTFLAWLRTSLGFASIGIAVTQLFRLNTSLQGSDPSSGSGNTDVDSRLRTLRQLGKPLGATFLGISILILFLGYHRYTETQQWVMRGKFPASRGIIILVSFVAFAVILASLVVVVAVHPRETEL